jgi:hypothetical protein
MQLSHGTVVNGKVVLEGDALPDGAHVYVLSGELDSPALLSSEELAELEAGLAEADRGETIPAMQVFEQLKKYD